MRRTLLLLVLVACKRGGEGPVEEEGEPAPIAVTCAPARTRAIADDIVVRGVIAAPPDHAAVVAPAVAGRIASVKVHEGDTVRAHQLLAVIEDPALDAAVAELDATKPGLDAAVTSAEAALARARKLFDAGIKPRRDVEDAEAALATAKAERAGLAARRKLAVAQRARAQVTAPIAGVVMRVLRNVGELVDGTGATPLLELADPSTLELRADAPADAIVRIPDRGAATITLDALPGRVLPATIALVSPAVDPITGLGVVRATIAPDAARGVRLALGLAGELRVPVAPRDAVVVPAGSVRRGEAGATEVVVCAGEVAAVREVEVGATRDADVEIVRGLAAGDRVVVDHVVGIEDGAAIAEREAP